MRPGRAPSLAPSLAPALTLTRRALATRLAGAAALAGFGKAVAAGTVAGAAPVPVPDPDLRDAALRGLALAGYRGDPVAAASAEAALARLSQSDPEAALLGRIYQLCDVRPAVFWPERLPAPAEADLACLHDAIRACQPVAFGYTDLSGRASTRSVLPLVLVHPAQGVKLLAWCEQRRDFRQFFVRAMQGLSTRPGGFSQDRLALLEGLLGKESARG